MHLTFWIMWQNVRVWYQLQLPWLNMQLFIELPARTCEADRSDFDHRAIHEPLVVNKTISCNSEWPVFVSQITTYTTDQTKTHTHTHTHTKSCKNKVYAKRLINKVHGQQWSQNKTSAIQTGMGNFPLTSYMFDRKKTNHDSWFLTPSLILFAMFPKCPLGYLSTHGQQNRSTKLGLKSPVKEVACNPEMLCIHTTPPWTNTKVQSGDSKTM